MAKQYNPNSGADLMPSRYTEQRTPQFVGGAISPTSGNVVPSTANEAARGGAQQSIGPGLAELLEPKVATTRLAQTTELPDDRPPPPPPAQGAAAQAAETANFVASTPTRVVNTGKSLWKSISSWF